jgi:hypothetical protein
MYKDYELVLQEIDSDMRIVLMKVYLNVEDLKHIDDFKRFLASKVEHFRIRKNELRGSK